MGDDLSFRLIDSRHTGVRGELDPQDTVVINRNGVETQMSVGEFLAPNGQFLGSDDKTPENRVSVKDRAQILSAQLSSLTGNSGLRYSAGRFSPSFQAFINTRVRDDGQMISIPFTAGNQSAAATQVQNTINDFVAAHPGISAEDVLNYNRDIYGGDPTRQYVSFMGGPSDYWNEGNIIRSLYENGGFPQGNNFDDGKTYYVQVILPVSPKTGEILIQGNQS